MSGLFDGIEDEKIRKGPRCGVAVLLDELEPYDADQLKDVLALPKERVPSVLIVRRLREASPPRNIQPYQINRHRNGDCACERT